MLCIAHLEISSLTDAQSREIRAISFYYIIGKLLLPKVYMLGMVKSFHVRKFPLQYYFCSSVYLNIQSIFNLNKLRLP